jgi:single-strand DNA-binding protein
MNILTFTTRFGQNAETKYTQAGKPITTVRCPVDSGWGDNKHTSWVTVVLFGERGEKLAPYIRKSGKATISGELRVREFQRNDGSNGTSVEVIMREIELQGDAPNSDQQADQQNQAPAQGGGFQPPADDFDDSVPF